MPEPHREVIRLAQEAHASIWRLSGDESTGDKLAAQITTAWQSKVQQAFGSRFQPEHPVAGHLRERIDLVDLLDGIAYELKVSPNNDHFEFYRDIFKILVAKSHLLPQIEAFCFLCPEIASRRYAKGLRQAVLQEGDRLGFKLHVAGI